MKKFLISTIIIFSNVASHANEENLIMNIVYKWNDLHNTRNTIEFKNLYAQNVLFYGKYYSGEKCYKRKTAFLTPNFNQEIITPVTLSYYSSGTIKCSFTKKVTFKNIVKEHICYLLVEKRNDKYVITGESDVITDQNSKIKLNLGEEVTNKPKSNTTTYALLSLAIISAGAVGYRLNKKKKKEDQFFADSTQAIKPDSFIPNPKEEVQKIVIDNNVVEKVKVAVLEEINGTAFTISTEKKKGDDFENYIVQLFNVQSGRFKLKEWRGDKMSSNGVYALSNHNPDLEFEFVDENRSYPFAIECKWRAKFQHREIEWAKQYQIQNYLNYQKKNKIPVFVAIGIGGKPSQPEQFYVAPLDEIHMYPKLFESYLKKFQRNPTNYFYYNPKQKMLY